MKIESRGPFNGTTIVCVQCSHDMMAQGATDILRVWFGALAIDICERHLYELGEAAVSICRPPKRAAPIIPATWFDPGPQPVHDVDGKRGSRQPAPHATQQGAATPGQRASAAAGNVAEPHRAPADHRSADPPTSLFDAEQKPMRISHVSIGPRGLELGGSVPLLYGKERVAAASAAYKDRSAPTYEHTVSQLDRYGFGFVPPSGEHDATCAYICKVPDACRRCVLEHSCTVCDAKARKEGRIA